MGHYWREMDPAGAEEHDNKVIRKSNLREKFKDITLGEFTVGELEAVMRLMGFAYDGVGTHEEHLRLLEKKVVTKNKTRK